VSCFSFAIRMPSMIPSETSGPPPPDIGWDGRHYRTVPMTKRKWMAGSWNWLSCLLACIGIGMAWQQEANPFVMSLAASAAIARVEAVRAVGTVVFTMHIGNQEKHSHLPQMKPPCPLLWAHDRQLWPFAVRPREYAPPSEPWTDAAERKRGKLRPASVISAGPSAAIDGSP
jgi:hypothetical protein